MQTLIKDLVSLEEHGVYIEKLGVSIKGTVLYVAADNLAAHALAGFQECFTVERVCRFCMAKREEIQEIEVSSGYYTLRNEEEHNRQVEEVLEDASKVQSYGVKRACVLSKNLQYSHVVRGFPPDILHDFLEEVVPFELALCLSDLIKKKYFSLEVP